MSEHVSRTDIEDKLRQIQDQVDHATDSAKPAALTAVVTVLGGALGLAYVIGQRRARKQTTIVEVRRV